MKSKRRGIAIVVTLLVIGILAIIALGLAAVSSGGLLNVHGERESAIAEMAAEGGAWHAARRLAKDTVPFTGFVGWQKMQNVNAEYTAEVFESKAPGPNFFKGIQVPVGKYLIYSTGRMLGSTTHNERHVALMVDRTTGVFNHAIFVQNSIAFEEQAYTDVYNSAISPVYAPAPLGSKETGAFAGHVGTNSNKKDAIKFDGDAGKESKLDPDAGGNPTANVYTGPGSAPDVVYTKGAPTGYYKSHIIMPSSQPFPDIKMDKDPEKDYTVDVVDTGDPTKWLPHQIVVGGVVYLDPNKIYKDVIIKPGTIVVLQPGATYYMNTLKVEGILEVPDINDPVTVKVNDTIEMLGSGAVINKTSRPANFRLELVNVKNKVTSNTIKGGSGAYYVAYCPKADVSVDGEIFGSVVGNKVTLKKGSAVHYDKALKSLSTPGAGGFLVVSHQRL